MKPSGETSVELVLPPRTTFRPSFVGFPWRSVVKTPPSSAEASGSIPGRRSRIHTRRDAAKKRPQLFPDQGQGHDVSPSPSCCNSNNNDTKQNHTHTHTRSPDHVLGRALGFWAMLMARPGQLVDRLWPDMGTDEGPDTWSGASGVRWGGAR